MPRKRGTRDGDGEGSMDQIKTNLMQKQVTVLWWMGGGRYSQELRQNAQCIHLAEDGSEKARLGDHSWGGWVPKHSRECEPLLSAGHREFRGGIN